MFRQCSGGYQANQTNHPPANGITRVKSTCDQRDDPPILLLHSCILNLCDSYHPILIVNNYRRRGENHFISRLSKTHEHFAGKTTHLLFEKHHISRVKLVNPPAASPEVLGTPLHRGFPRGELVLRVSATGVKGKRDFDHAVILLNHTYNPFSIL